MGDGTAADGSPAHPLFAPASLADDAKWPVRAVPVPRPRAGSPVQTEPKVAFRSAVYFHHGRGRGPAHEIGGCHEGVEHARVLPLALGLAEAAVEGEGILAAQVGRAADADQAKVGRERWADVRQLLEAQAFGRALRLRRLDDHVTSACCCG
jgi:hypothetical protein